MIVPQPTRCFPVQHTPCLRAAYTQRLLQSTASTVAHPHFHVTLSRTWRPTTGSTHRLKFCFCLIEQRDVVIGGAVPGRRRPWRDCSAHGHCSHRHACHRHASHRHATWRHSTRRHSTWMHSTWRHSTRRHPHRCAHRHPRHCTSGGHTIHLGRHGAVRTNWGCPIHSRCAVQRRSVHSWSHAVGSSMRWCCVHVWCMRGIRRYRCNWSAHGTTT